MLRYAAFEPRATGIRTMLPHVDLFLPGHNIDSLDRLSRLLQQDTDRSNRKLEEFQAA
jgi:uncharacterized protein with von Willebrand factor type A (vWA) domain